MAGGIQILKLVVRSEKSQTIVMVPDVVFVLFCAIYHAFANIESKVGVSITIFKNCFKGINCVSSFGSGHTAFLKHNLL